MLDLKCTSTQSVLKLAYIGDAVFELLVRMELLSESDNPLNIINKQARDKVRANAQAKMYNILTPIVTEEELNVMRRGRNAKSHSWSKSAGILEYRHSTGVEALFGYLYLKGEYDRITQLFKICYNMDCTEKNSTE